MLTATDPRFAAGSTFSRAVARILLYCHGLVLEDPLALAAAMYLNAAADLRTAARRIFETGITTATEIDDLVDSGVITLYWIPETRQRHTQEITAPIMGAAATRDGPEWVAQVWDAFEAMFVDGLHPALRELWRRVRAGDRSPDLALLQQAVDQGETSLAGLFVDVISELRSSAVVENVVEILAIAVDDMAALGGNVDLYAPSALFTRLLLAPIVDPSDADTAHVRELSRVDVPQLDELSSKNLISVRRDEETFALWRMHLSRGLDRVAEYRERGLWTDAHRALTTSCSRHVSRSAMQLSIPQYYGVLLAAS